MHHTPLTLTYNKVKNRFFINGHPGSKIKCSGRVATILGFKPGIFLEVGRGKQTSAPHPADIQAGLYNIFVYTNIIDFQFVGGQYVQLLKTVNIPHDNNKIITCTFDSPHYNSVPHSHIQDIEINLKTDQNSFLPFSYGKVIVKLHFRPVKQLF